VDLVFRFLLGGVILTLVSYFSTKGMPQLAGIIMTFPAMTVTSLLVSPASQQKDIALWGLIGIATFAAFVGVYLLLVRFNGENAKLENLLGSMAVWVLLVGLTFYFVKR
jgi:uncharacterized membrane protein (GlpM family)